AGLRAVPRAEPARVLAVLPAAVPRRGWKPLWRRGAAALAVAGWRPAHLGGIRTGCRGIGPDRGPGRLGARGGLRAAGTVARCRHGAASAGGEPLRAAAAGCAAGADAAPPARAPSPHACVAGLRDQRIRADR